MFIFGIVFLTVLLIGVKAKQLNVAQILLLLAMSGLLLWLGGTESYDAYSDLYFDNTQTLIGVIESEDAVGNHGNYTVVEVNGKRLYNPGQRFQFEIGSMYQIEYYEKTKYIYSKKEVLK